VRCAQAREKLTEYQLGMLGDAATGEVERHLAECAQCREELAALERLDALVSPAEQYTAPEGMWHGVRAGMKPRRRPWWEAWRVAPKPALAMAAAMLLAVSGIWIGLRGGPVETSAEEVLGAEYQEQQIAAQWSQPLADDAALGVMYASLDAVGETQ